MQGRNPYQGQAPTNMDFPTEAYVQAHGQAYGRLGDAYTQAAALEAQGRQQMTEGLTKGLMGAFSEFKAGREAEKNFAAGRSMLESPFFQEMLGMEPGEAVDFGSYLDLIREKQGARTANNVMESTLGNIIKYAQASRQFENELALQRLRNQGALDVAGMPAKSSGRQVVPGTSFQLQDSTVNPD